MSTPPHETQRTIAEWAFQTFGPVRSNASIAARANREMAELLFALSVEDDGDEDAIGEEIADVVIVLSRLADRIGIDLAEAVDRKMAKNRAREWVLDGHGHGQHK